MTPYLDDGDITLYHGDALETLRQLPTGSVDMVATSPPFYGLRDYGTGTWEGGNPDCDHLGAPFRTKSKLNENWGAGYSDVKNTEDREPMKQSCSKCGARRVDRQIGLEETPDQWVANLVQVFRECRRVLADHGTLWVEIGDSYNANQGSGFDTNQDGDKNGRKAAGATRRIPWGKPKDLLGQPWMLAFALRADGWYLRSEIIWARPNPMPESVTDRPTKSHSTVFLLSKRPRYFYDQDAIRQPHKVAHLQQQNAPLKKNANGESKALGKQGLHDFVNPAGANARSVWEIPTEPTPFAHFATWPQKLVARMIQAGTSERGCCPECGVPWVRQTEDQGYTKHRPSAGNDPRSRSEDKQAEGSLGGHHGWKGNNLLKNAPLTLGWSSSCAHDTAPVPCTVLDPFAGSGTTLLVARHHGRHAIGIELNADYCAIAAKQLQQLSLLT